MDAVLAGTAFVAMLGVLWSIAGRIAQGSLGVVGIVWRVLLGTVLVSLLTIPDAWPLGVAAVVVVASGVVTGARRGIGSLDLVQRTAAYVRPRSFRVVILPILGLVAIDFFLEGYWSPTEALVGGLLLSALIGVAVWLLGNPPRTIGAAFGQSLALSAVLAVVAGVIDQPFRPWQAAPANPTALLLFPLLTFALFVCGLWDVRRGGRARAQPRSRSLPGS